MNREGHNSVTFFIGPEVEYTPAHSKKTLFVVGFQSTEEIENIAREQKVQHIFLGANHSFDATHRTAHFDKTWNTQVETLLNRGYWVTVDYQAHQHKDVLEIFSSTVWRSRNFIPLLSVRVPKVQESSHNLTIKIDDVDFEATNPGVWCMNYREATDNNRFTSWNEYTTDEIIKTEVKVVPDVPAQVISAPADVVQQNNDSIKNDNSVGLDTEVKEPLESVVTEVTANVTVEDAANAYADAVKPKKSKGAK